MTEAIGLALLPPEILADIVDYLDDAVDEAIVRSRNALHVAQTCTYLYECFLPLVYRSLQLDVYVKEGLDVLLFSEKSHAICSALLSNSMACHVLFLGLNVGALEGASPPIHILDDEFDSTHLRCVPQTALPLLSDMNPSEILVCNNNKLVRWQEPTAESVHKFNSLLWPGFLSFIGKTRLRNYSGLHWGGLNSELFDVLTGASQLCGIYSPLADFRRNYRGIAMPSLRTLVAETGLLNLPVEQIPNLTHLSMMAGTRALLDAAGLKRLESLELTFWMPWMDWDDAEDLEEDLLQCVQELENLKRLAFVDPQEALDIETSERSGFFRLGDLRNLFIGISNRTVSLERLSFPTSYFPTPERLMHIKNLIKELRQAHQISRFEVRIESHLFDLENAVNIKL